MGNNNITPAQHAISSYTSFINSILTDDFIKNIKNIKSGKCLQDKLDREFGLFLDDFIVNDSDLEKYKENGKKICLASMCLLHSTSPFDVSDIECLNKPPIIHAESVVKFFNDNSAPGKVLGRYLTSKYVWDSSSFYEFTDKGWTPCSEESLSPGSLFSRDGLPTIVRTCGVNNTLLTEGLNDLSVYLKSLIDAASSFKNSDEYKKAVEEIKSEPIKFNLSPDKIPCHSGPVNISKGSQTNYTYNDLFNTKLNIDPSKETTKLVSNFVSKFNCESEALANYLVRCGASLQRTLTLVCGPKNSGKSTLLRVTRNLYGPYACDAEDHASCGVNYDLVRTCFVDDTSFLTEEAVSSHPCDHLVVACESSEIGDEFAGRRVKRLVFTEALDSNSTKKDITINLSTRKQLGSLLGWALQNYNPICFGSSSGDISSNFLSMLMGGAEACGNTNCKGCNGGSMETPAEFLEMMASARIVKMGPNGMEHVDLDEKQSNPEASNEKPMDTE